MNVLALLRRAPDASGRAHPRFGRHKAQPAVAGIAAEDSSDPQGVAGAQTIVFAGAGLQRDGKAILADVDLVLSERRIAILGANGSGKTSLLRLMIGLAAPTTGTVSVGGRDPVREADAVRARTGYLFQNADNQIVHPLVREDLAFGLGGSRQAVAPLVERALAKLGIGDLIDRRIHELSGGERQLVALAGILARDPTTILFDEPTSQLDLKNRNRLRRILAALPQQAVVVTHDLEFIEDFDRVIVLDDGRIVCDAAPSEATAFYRSLCA